MKKFEVLTIKLNKEINLHLTVKIELYKTGEISLSNEKLNITSLFENIEESQAKKEYAFSVIQSIAEFAKEGILLKVFESAGIKLMSGVEAKAKIEKELQEAINKEKTILTNKNRLISPNQYELLEDDLSLIIDRIANNGTNWQNQAKA